MKKHRSCDELGICQGLGADQCPDCDSFECSVPCSDPPVPTLPLAAVAYPFAPRVIERANTTDAFAENDSGFPLNLPDLVFVVCVTVAFGGLGGLLATWLIGRL